MLKRFILWDYHRGSWQYDVMVGIILAFIFLTPRDWFRDTPKPVSIAMLPSEGNNLEFIVDARILYKIPENQRAAELTKLLQTHMNNRRLKVVRVEPNLDSEGELQGYIAIARP